MNQTKKLKTALPTMRRIGCIICALILLISAFSICACRQKTNDPAPEPTGPTYKTTIQVECDENLLFSKYDLKISVDGKQLGKLDHGQSETYEVELESGSHTFTSCSADSSSVDGSKSFTVEDKETDLRYKLSCTSSQVEIKEIEQIKAPDASSLSGKTKDDVVKAFEEAGFTNISTDEVNDLTIDQIDKNQTVEKVSVGGDEKYSSSDTFFADTEVIITYHTLAEINPPDSSDVMEALTCDEAVAQFQAAGFSNVTTKSISSSTEATGKISDITIGIWTYTFSKTDTFPYDEEVVIRYYENTGSGSSSSSSSTSSGGSYTSDPWVVFEQYGSYYYPYGFKCHWYTNKLAETTESDGSVFLKVGVSIKNAYGVEYDTVAEGTVMGETVTYFYVYE